jgi:hypothetical protein
MGVGKYMGKVLSFIKARYFGTKLFSVGLFICIMGYAFMGEVSYLETGVLFLILTFVALLIEGVDTYMRGNF